jgi:hypothetical protein
VRIAGCCLCCCPNQTAYLEVRAGAQDSQTIESQKRGNSTPHFRDTLIEFELNGSERFLHLNLFNKGIIFDHTVADTDRSLSTLFSYESPHWYDLRCDRGKQYAGSLQLSVEFTPLNDDEAGASAAAAQGGDPDDDEIFL